MTRSQNSYAVQSARSKVLSAKTSIPEIVSIIQREAGRQILDEQCIEGRQVEHGFQCSHNTVHQTVSLNTSRLLPPHTNTSFYLGLRDEMSESLRDEIEECLREMGGVRGDEVIARASRVMSDVVQRHVREVAVGASTGRFWMFPPGRITYQELIQKPLMSYYDQEEYLQGLLKKRDRPGDDLPPMDMIYTPSPLLALIEGDIRRRFQNDCENNGGDVYALWQDACHDVLPDGFAGNHHILRRLFEENRPLLEPFQPDEGEVEILTGDEPALEREAVLMARAIEGYFDQIMEDVIYETRRGTYTLRLRVRPSKITVMGAWPNALQSRVSRHYATPRPESPPRQAPSMQSQPRQSQQDVVEIPDGFRALLQST